MTAPNWEYETDALKVSKRAKGRDRYNAQRGGAALWRRFQAGKLLKEFDFPLQRGWQSELARRLGVHRSTICRDFALLKGANASFICAASMRDRGYGGLADVCLAVDALAEIDEAEENRRMGWRLDRRRKLGLPW